MRASIITTVRHNVGDDFVREGILYLLATVREFDRFEFIHKHSPASAVYGLERIRTLRASNAIEPLTRFWARDRVTTADVLLQGGAPVYWCHPGGPHCADNEWFGPLIRKRFLPERRGRKFLNLAGGSCQRYHSDGSELDACPKCRAYIRELFDACDLTTVRDELARSMLNRAGRDAAVLACTSIFARDRLGLKPAQGDYIVLNFMETGGHYTFGQAIDAALWRSQFKELARVTRKMGHVVAACHTKHEENLAKELIPHVERFRVPNDHLEFMKFYARAKFGVVNRVHAGFIMASLGKPAAVIGNDSRALMIQNLNLPSYYVSEVASVGIEAIIDSARSKVRDYPQEIEAIRSRAKHEYITAISASLYSCDCKVLPRKVAARQDSLRVPAAEAPVVPRLSNCSIALQRVQRFMIHFVAAVIRVGFDTAVLIASPRHVRGETVCLIRLDAIGDFILWLESAKRLRTYYKAKRVEVTLIANAAWASWARELDLADEVWEIDPIKFNRDWSYRAAWLKRMGSAGFDKVIQPAHSRVVASGDSLVRASKAQERVGSFGDTTNTLPWLKRWSDAWYTRLIKCGDETRMELLRNAEFMRGFGFADFQARVPKLPNDGMVPPASLMGKAYAVLVPGASWSGKAWPVTSFAEVGRRLVAHGLSLVIVGGRSERLAADALFKELKCGAEDLVGRTSLKELLSIMRNARIVISNDTGPAHVAAAAGVPVICILGGGHYGRFMPYRVEVLTPGDLLPVAISVKLDCFGCNWACVFPQRSAEPLRCVKEVTVDHVWQRTVSCLVDGAQNGRHLV